MKKKDSPDGVEDLRPEYGPELFANMKPNRFAETELKFKGKDSAGAKAKTGKRRAS